MKNLVVSACRLDTLCGGGGSATHFSCTASDGRLLVATSHGQLLCFQGNKASQLLSTLLFMPTLDGGQLAL